VALAQEEESQRTFQEETYGRGRPLAAGENQAAGVTVLLARAVRLAGVSRSATAGYGYDNKPVTCGVGPRGVKQS
jgi:hypothetical protein